MRGVAVERDRLERLQRRHEQRAARRLVHAARLHADQAVLDDVDAADAVPAADLVQRLHQRRRRELPPFTATGHARLEADRHLLRRVRRVHRIGGQLEHRRLGLERRVLERAALVGEVPEVAVARVRIFLRHRHGDAVRGGVVDRVLARDDVPLAPRRDDLQLRRERLIGELEAHLIVALAGAAVRERVAAGRQRDLDLLARDERPRDRRAEQVVALVDRAGLQHREEVVGRELFLRVDEMEVARAGRCAFCARPAVSSAWPTSTATATTSQP